MTAGSQDPGTNSSRDDLAAALELAHESLVACLRETNEIAERAVLDSGNALNAIVIEAMAQLDDAARSMNGTAGEDGSLGDALRTSSETLADYLACFDRQTEALGDQMQVAVAGCRQVANFVKEFDSAILTCDALAIFMKIEVARLPAKDHHVGVLADELRSLSMDLRRLADNVESVSGGLSAELTGVADSAQRSASVRAEVSTTLDASIGEIEELGAKLEATLRMSLADGPTMEIVRCSQQALSRLQYQEPLTQELQRLDSLAAELRTQVASSAGRSGVVAPLVYAARLGDKDASPADAPASGVFLFF